MMLNTTPTELQTMWEQERKAHCAIRDSKSDGEREAAQARWHELGKLYHDARYRHANELLFAVRDEDAVAVLYSRKHGYCVTVAFAENRFEHFGPYKTEENAVRYASKKHDIDFSAPIAESAYEHGTDDAYNMLRREDESAMVRLRDEVMESEGNCEDAVNVLAYEAYQLLYGETPICEMGRVETDRLMGLARRHVRDNSFLHGFDWEEF